MSVSNGSGEKFGGGPTLDKYWDFEINGSGDINTDSGQVELEKDLGYRVEPVLRSFLGSIPSVETEEQLKTSVRTVLAGDERVRGIRETVVTFEEDTIKAETVVVTANGPFAFVEEVSQ